MRTIGGNVHHHRQAGLPGLDKRDPSHGARGGRLDEKEPPDPCRDGHGFSVMLGLSACTMHDRAPRPPRQSVRSCPPVGATRAVVVVTDHDHQRAADPLHAAYGRLPDAAGQENRVDIAVHRGAQQWDRVMKPGRLVPRDQTRDFRGVAGHWERHGDSVPAIAGGCVAVWFVVVRHRNLQCRPCNLASSLV